MHQTTSSPRLPSTPLGCLLNAYDQAITACRSKSASRAYRMITLLREAHPADSPAAAGIDAIYAWCERAVLGGDYFGAARTLEQLRTAWEAADRITSVPALPQAPDTRFTAWEPLRPEPSRPYVPPAGHSTPEA